MEALASYRMPAAEEPRRNGPDTDRIMAINFRRGDWGEVIAEFEKAGWEPVDDRQIVMNGFFTATSAPWARCIAIAMARAGRLEDKVLVRKTRKLFAMTEAAWDQLTTWASAASDEDLVKSYQKMLPKAVRKPSRSLDDALALGATQRAKDLAAWIQAAPDAVERAKKNLEFWLVDGDRTGLDGVVAWVSEPVLYKVAASALFEFTNRTKIFQGPKERVLELYRAHPYLMRYGMGHYLSLLIQNDLPFTGEDLLGGVFQALGFPGRDFMLGEDDISLQRLKACEDWALQRLEDWQGAAGRKSLEAARIALKGLPEYRIHDIRREETWLKAMDQAIAWLGARWKEEIGASLWQSEMLAFDLLKRAFKGRRVLQHDDPAWLTPQHLDIHIPEIDLAVEYMGVQHYEPIEAWGGEAALKRNQERDHRKAALCVAAGVTLEYIRHDEEIGTRVAEIAMRHGGIVPPPRKKSTTKRTPHESIGARPSRC